MKRTDEGVKTDKKQIDPPKQETKELVQEILHQMNGSIQQKFMINLLISLFSQGGQGSSLQARPSSVLLVHGEAERQFVQRLLQLHGRGRAGILILPGVLNTFSDFWTLLGQLKIPSFALLDLKQGATLGGWVQIKETARQLVTAYGSLGKRLGFGMTQVNQITANTSPAELDFWLQTLERLGLFFNQPRDFDELMLTSYYSAYCRELGQPRDTPLDKLRELLCVSHAEVHRAVLSHIPALDLMEKVPLSLQRLLARLR